MRLRHKLSNGARMREETQRLFPLSTIGSVVQLFRYELTHSDHDPDIVLLSIVAGCIENSLTSPRTGAVSEVGNCILEISGELITCSGWQLALCQCHRF